MRPATKELARLGCSGQHPQNANRDLENLCKKRKLTGDLELYKNSVLGRDLKGNVVERDWQCLLPHEIAHALFKYDKSAFVRRFGADEQSLRNYWQNVQGREWFAQHPHREYIASHPEHCIPIRFHGDDARNSHRAMTFLASMSGCCCRLQTNESRHPLLCLPLSLSLGVYTLDQMFEPLAWSLRLFFPADGDPAMPCADHTGMPFHRRSKRAQQATDNICGPYRLVLTQFSGDWKWLKEILRFKHSYNNDEFCFRCCATKSSGPMCGWADDGWCFQAHRSNINFLQNLSDYGSSLLDIPGFHVRMITLDLMHIALLGIMQWLVGGVLFELCRENAWPCASRGGWRDRMNAQLALAYTEFRDWLLGKNVCITPRIHSEPALLGQFAGLGLHEVQGT